MKKLWKALGILLLAASGACLLLCLLKKRKNRYVLNQGDSYDLDEAAF